MAMGRTPNQGRDKVKVFGAWLDADVAGRKAGQGNRAQGLKERAARGEELSTDEKAEVYYEESVACMAKGQYEASRAMLDRAVGFAGADTRRGGEFKLWMVQALQGVGREEEAVKLLKGMKGHRDADVRKVSQELLFIAQAPKLALTDKDFVAFGDIDVSRDKFDKSMYKELRNPKAPFRRGWQPKEEPAYVVKPVTPPPENDPVLFAILSVTVLGLSVLLLKPSL